MFRLFRQFINIYFSRKGYRDGFRGLSISYLSVIYRLVTHLKFKLMVEYDSTNPREEILADYQSIADNLISEYKKIK